MSRKRKHEPAPGQMTLELEVFTVTMPNGEKEGAVGDSAIDAGLRKIIADTLDKAHKNRLTRERVADQMSAMLGRKITKTQLDQWAAPSQTEKRIPADALIALITITAELAALEWLASRFDRKLLTEDEALCAEYGAMAVLNLHTQEKQKAIQGQMNSALLDQILNRIQKVKK